MPPTSAYTAAGFIDPSHDQVSFEVQAGKLDAITYLAATNNTVVDIQGVYSATADAVMRMRDVDGSLIWDTSPDGVTFTQFATTSDASFPLSVMSGFLSANTDANSANNAGVVSYSFVEVTE
jgi:hypothetical protein